MESVMAMMKAGNLEGAFGDEVYDFLDDEIENEAQTAWSGSVGGSDEGKDNAVDDSRLVEIREYEGIYFVWALEEDPVGYFLNHEDAKSYVVLNWMGDVREDSA
jgi:hypothetical protein